MYFVKRLCSCMLTKVVGHEDLLLQRVAGADGDGRLVCLHSGEALKLASLGPPFLLLL